MSVAGRYGRGGGMVLGGRGGYSPGGTVRGSPGGVCPPVDRQTPVKALPSRNFVCRR